jgi:hypothetical protein
MKQIVGILVILLVLSACQDIEQVPTDFTGSETTYALLAGSTYPVTGTVTFKEKKDGTTLIRIELSGTEGDLKLPVHLHLGTIATPDAEIAALLTPVTGKTGISETNFSGLANETPLSYQDLLRLSACVKVHLAASGPDRDIILAGGNIGVASLDESAGGRVGFRTCKSE